MRTRPGRPAGVERQLQSLTDDPALEATNLNAARPALDPTILNAAHAATGHPPDTNADWYRFTVPRALATMSSTGLAADQAAAEADIDAVLRLTGLPPTSRLLEVGCGWGRHSVVLAARGFADVLSIDIVPEALALAHRLAAERGLRLDQRELPLVAVTAAHGPFDAVLSLYDRSLCGYPTEAEDRVSLERVASLLKPGGWLIVGINDWPATLPQAAVTEFAVSDGRLTVEVIPDLLAGTCTHRLTFHPLSGSPATYALTRRHYSAAEVVALLREAGFAVEAVRHRLSDAHPHNGVDEGLWVVARRAPILFDAPEPAGLQ